MPDNGVRTIDLTNLASAEDLLAHDDGTLGMLPLASLSTRLAASGALAEAIAGRASSEQADALAAEIDVMRTEYQEIGADLATLDAEDLPTRVQTLEEAQVGGFVAAATWTGLLAITPSVDGTAGEVSDSDTGTHSDASGTGYDGDSVPNAGRYSWNDSWGRWVWISDTGLSGKLNSAANLSDVADAATARGNLEAAAQAEFEAEAQARAAVSRDVARVRAGGLGRDGVEGWAWPVMDRAGKVAGGFRRDGSFHAQGLGVSVPALAARDVPRIPLVRDAEGHMALGLEPDGKLILPALSEQTITLLQSLVGGAGSAVPGGLFRNVPGWNHRIYDATHHLVTMPTAFGPVDVLYPVAGSGLAFAVTRQPVELLSVSGQSNIFLGGNKEAGINGFVLRGVRDPHRAFRSAHGTSWGDGTGSAAAYSPGDLSAIVPSGQDEDSGTAGQFTPDVIQFSAIATDAREAREQRVYLQLTSAESGTSLTQYMAGTPKGDNIASYIPAAETLMQGTYGRDLIMYAHFLIGHEGLDFTGYDDYGALLSAFADEVCGYGAALEANVAADVRPKVITYQPNSYITDAATPNGTTIRQTALDTLDTALTDPDVVCIGPVYHERTVDNGIHMTGKLMTGELFAHVYDRVRSGAGFTPLHITSASREGAVITLELDGPAGFLMLDDDWMPALEHGGIHYGDDSDSAAIVSVALVTASATSRSIVVTLDAVPGGANPTISVAGHTNTTDETRPGGMASIYIPGPRSFWHAAGYTEFTTPEIRFYICRQRVAVS
ncbi:hypothetical protein [Salipiger marinus]|uniref:Sialate O-acetylesterase domain-containing protein n=1 Tax=Salipiger marinus TaxID=555512 RepID=A0A1G8JHU4_9RHOB|nr:hypothetical protein [Salipiger marinus]SDI30775.1 hypothetical protein SAMN04487993_100374 [Salipiger marinus]